jgi:hypothetical protein
LSRRSSLPATEVSVSVVIHIVNQTSPCRARTQATDMLNTALTCGGMPRPCVGADHSQACWQIMAFKVPICELASDLRAQPGCEQPMFKSAGVFQIGPAPAHEAEAQPPDPILAELFPVHGFVG